MSYFGPGQTAGFEDMAGKTFEFLKEALRQVTPDLPYRGPTRYERWDNGDKWMYNFHLDGSFEDFSWQEEIVRGNGKGSDYVFSQRGGGGIIIGKDENGNPRLPWGVGGGE